VVACASRMNPADMKNPGGREGAGVRRMPEF
jgi:hypothetical protein